MLIPLTTMQYTSSFLHDVMFSHNGANGARSPSHQRQHYVSLSSSASINWAKLPSIIALFCLVE